MDTYAEHIVKKIPTGNDTLKKVLAASVSIITGTLIAIVFMPIGLLFAMAIFYGGYYWFTIFDIEYEYAVTNGEIDIDKIIAKRKRKKMLTVNAGTFETFAKIENGNLPDNNDNRTVFMLSGGENEYYADFNHSEYGKSRLIFSPNEKMLDCINPYLPRSIR